jgi:hypothetical protein
MARERKHPLENVPHTILAITNHMQSKWNLEPWLQILKHACLFNEDP